MADIPYVDLNKLVVTTEYCISDTQRDKQMEYAIANVSGRLEPGPDRGDDSIAVVCYGPSLIDEWQKVRDYTHIITCSGAHKFLIDRGIIPTYHVDVDPRPHKLSLLGTPHPSVEYLLASAIHPNYIDALRDYNVKLWHGFGGDNIKNLPLVYPRGEWVFAGGCTVGLRALLLARFLGYKNMGLFGMDCSFPHESSSQHAGFHPNPAKDENIVHAPYEGVVYKTTVAMVEYARQFFKELTLLPDVKLAIHGNGMLQHMAYTGWKDPDGSTVRREAILAFRAPEIITKAYLEQNKILHQVNPAYGVSGAKYAAEVIAIAKELDTADVLDYGCGKGTLAGVLPWPIKEYDPAIEGKDSTPRPADLVVCTDVLEHIEPELLDNVLGDIARCTIKMCYAVVATGAAQKTLPDGRNCHLIQQNADWWRLQLGKYFRIINAVDAGTTAIFHLKPVQNSSTLQELDRQTLSFEYLEVDGVKFVSVNNATDWRINTFRTKEPSTVEWLESFKEGQVLFDIGANMGLYALWAAKNRGTITYAFEPESQNYALLNQNIYLNELWTRVKAYNICLSDKFTVGELYLTEVMPASSCHQFNQLEDYNGQPGKFAFEQGAISLALDYLVDTGSLPQPNHIKIDIDGLEPKVVLGGIKTIMACDSLLIEVNPKLDSHQAMLKILSSLGFSYSQDQVDRSTRKDGPFTGVGEYVFRRT